MKIIKNVILYKCEYCGKKYQRKHACHDHEIICNKNPKNRRPCLNGCKHLESIKILRDRDGNVSAGGIPVSYQPSYANTFKCTKHDVVMYHPKCEYSEYLQGIIEETDQDPMPKECADFEEKE